MEGNNRIYQRSQLHKADMGEPIEEDEDCPAMGYDAYDD